MITNQNLRELSIADLQLVVSLIKHGNSSVSADELGISQPSISYHLRRLRTIFSDEMFVRTGKGLKATERCLQVGFFAKEIISRVEEELIHANNFDPCEMQRELRIVADDTACHWFGDLFIELHRSIPKITLCARPWNFNSMEDLDAGTTDFGIHIIENSKKCIYDINIIPCYRLCIVRNGHPLISNGKVDMKDLELYPVIINDLSGWNNDGNSIMQTVLAKHGLKLNIAGRIGYASSILRALQGTNAILYTSAIALPQDLDGFTILKAPEEIDVIECFYRLYISKAKYGSQETNYLIEFIYDSFRKFATRQYERPEVVSLIKVS